MAIEYTPNEWNPGDIIDESKLDHLEGGVVAAASAAGEAVAGLASKAAVTDLPDPSTEAGAAVQAAIASFGTRLPLVGGPMRQLAPSATLPSSAQEGDTIDHMLPAGPLRKVYWLGAWRSLNGTAFTPPTAPVTSTLTFTNSAPIITTTGAGSSASVQLNWSVTVGTDGLAPVAVRISRDGVDNAGTGAYTVDQDSLSGSLTMDRLLVGATYHFTATMLNASDVAIGSAQALTVIIPSTPPPVSTATTTLSIAAAPGDGRVTVTPTVTEGTDGLNVTGVKVGRNGTDTNGSGPWSTVDPVNTPRIFDSLVNGTSYTFTADLMVGGVAQGNPKSVNATPNGTTTTPPPTGGNNGGTSTNAKLAAITMPARGWFSGAAGENADNGNTAFGVMRGDPIDFIATWHDIADGGGWNLGAMSTKHDGPTAGFTGLADYAIGGPTNYSAAVGGSLDAALRSGLTNLRASRTISGVLRPTVIRMCHELNGNWYKWSLKPGMEAQFRQLAQRWKNIANDVFPEALWAVCFNGDNVAGIDPGACVGEGIFDIIGVDQYNAYPYIGTRRNGSFLSWDSGSNLGTVTNPRGFQKWRQFAQNKGLPIYLPEYANRATPSDVAGAGDDPYWINNFMAYVKANRGKGAGQVFGECWFNAWPDYTLYGSSNNMPNVRAAYANLFPVVG